MWKAMTDVGGEGSGTDLAHPPRSYTFRVGAASVAPDMPMEATTSCTPAKIGEDKAADRVRGRGGRSGKLGAMSYGQVDGIHGVTAGRTRQGPHLGGIGLIRGAKRCRGAIGL